jgi:hypothetical protein
MEYQIALNKAEGIFFQEKIIGDNYKCGIFMKLVAAIDPSPNNFLYIVGVKYEEASTLTMEQTMFWINVFNEKFKGKTIFDVS